MKDYLRILFAAIGAAVSARCCQYLVNGRTENLPAVFWSSIIGMATYTFIVVLIELLVRFRFIRKHVDSRAKHEGLYVEICIHYSDRPVSIGCIAYDQNTDSHFYRGRTFGVQGELKAIWKTTGTGMQFKGDEAAYEYTSIVYDGGREDKVIGHGILMFGDNAGYFLDVCKKPDLHWNHHDLHKLSESEIYSLIQKHEARIDDYKDLALEYYRKIHPK